MDNQEIIDIFINKLPITIFFTVVGTIVILTVWRFLDMLIELNDDNKLS